MDCTDCRHMKACFMRRNSNMTDTENWEFCKMFYDKDTLKKGAVGTLSSGLESKYKPHTT